MKEFRDFANESSEHELEPALKAEEVGHKILESSQRLRVSTIDSTYLDWYRKFPWEAKAEGEYLLPPLFEMATTQMNFELDEMAWNFAVKEIMEENTVLKEIESHSDRAASLDHLKNIVFALQRHESFVWIAEKSSGKSAVLSFDLNSDMPLDPKEALESLRADFDLAKAYMGPSPKKALESALGTCNLDSFIDAKLVSVSKGYYLSKSKFKKLASENPDLYDSLSKRTSSYFLGKRLKKINDLGPIYYEVFKKYIAHRKRLKSEKGIIDFNDPARASFQLFTSPEASGATYLIHRNTQHLLLDEFQDTSYLQWEIFSRMSEEILSGEGYQEALSLKPSVFIVGDSKQSIYGFRMADSSIMTRASSELSTFGIKLTSLNKSFRTSQSVLDWVNSTFDGVISDFPKHETASFSGKTVVPNLSNLCIADIFTSEKDENGKSTEKVGDLIKKEADYVAHYIAKSVEGGSEPLTIFDKKTKKYRHLKASDCAILYRNKSNSDLYMKSLLEKELKVKERKEKAFLIGKRLEII